MMPQLGESVTEGTITRWFKSVGDTVTEDEPLFEVSTDKVDTEVPSPASGVLTEIRVEEGETVDVGTVLAVLGEAVRRPRRSDVPPSSADSRVAGPAADARPTPEPRLPCPPLRRSAAPHTGTPAPIPAPGTSACSGTSARRSTAESLQQLAAGLLLSPLVRRLVEEHGLDPDAIAGTGVGGRITREDVLDAVDASGGASLSPRPAAARGPVAARGRQPAAVPTAARRRPGSRPMRPGAGDVVEPLNRIRRMTGDLMVASKATSPHVITVVEVDYSAIEAARLPRREAFRAETRLLADLSAVRHPCGGGRAAGVPPHERLGG